MSRRTGTVGMCHSGHSAAARLQISCGGEPDVILVVRILAYRNATVVNSLVEIEGVEVE
jgi:hypothetical protein